MKSYLIEDKGKIKTIYYYIIIFIRNATNFFQFLKIPCFKAYFTGFAQ
jgi:hypothetical protein